MTHRTILLNNFSNVAKLVFYILVSFFMTPFYVHTLGVTLYGIWAMVLSVVGYMTLMDFGMQNAVMKYIAECEGKEDKEGLSEIIISALVFYSLIAIVGSSFLIIFVFQGLPLLRVDPYHFSIVKWVLLIMGIDMLLVFPGTVFQGALTGMQLFYVTNSISIVVNFIKAVMIYLALSRSHGLIEMALIILLMNLLEYGIFFALVKWRYRLFPIRRSHFSPARLKQMMSFSIKSFLVIISRRISLSSDSLMIGYFMSAAWVPFYTIPANLINYTRTLLWSLTQSFLPLFSQLEAKGNIEEIRSIYMRYTRYTCLCLFPILVFLLIFGEPFLRIWMGIEFAEKGRYVILFLTLSLFFSAINPLGGRLLTGTSRQGILVWTGFTSAFIFVGLGALLIRTHGLTGLAIAFMAGSLIPSVFVLGSSVLAINVSLKDYIRDGLFPALMPASITLVLLWVIKGIHYPLGYLELTLQAGAGVLMFAVAGYIIALTLEEKLFVNNIAKGLYRFGMPTHWKL